MTAPPRRRLRRTASEHASRVEHARALASQPVLWTPHPGFQRRALACTARELLAGGAAGPGKTDLLLYGPLRYIDQSWQRVLFLRESYPALAQAMDRSHGVFPALGGAWSGERREWRFPSGATYRFGHAADLPSLVAVHQGSEYTHVAWDEIGLTGDPALWRWIATRVRSGDPRAVLQMRCSANPGGPGHRWLRRRFVDPCGPGGGEYRDPVSGHRIAYIPGRLADNPTLDAPDRQDYRRALEAAPELLRRQLLDGDWSVAEGLAFGEIELAVHLEPVAPVPSWWTRWGGLDWGYQHWTVAVDLAADDEGVVHVLDTVWARRTQPDALCELLWERLPIQSWSACYAGRDLWHQHRARGLEGPTLAQVFLGHHIPVVPADLDRLQRASLVRDLLGWRGRGDGHPRLRFHDTPGNRRLLSQLETLSCDPARPEDVLGVDADEHDPSSGDDGYDALGHGLLSWRRRATQPPEPLDLFDPRMLADVAARAARHTLPDQRPALKAETLDWW